MYLISEHVLISNILFITTTYLFVIIFNITDFICNLYFWFPWLCWNVVLYVSELFLKAKRFSGSYKRFSLIANWLYITVRYAFKKFKVLIQYIYYWILCSMHFFEFPLKMVLMSSSDESIIPRTWGVKFKPTQISRPCFRKFYKTLAFL